jgi:hypothetical protein
MIGAHKRAIARAKKELGLDKCAKQRIAHRTIQAPQPLRLGDRQAKTRHLEVLAFHTSKHIEWLFHSHSSLPLGCSERSSPLFSGATGVPVIRSTSAHVLTQQNALEIARSPAVGVANFPKRSTGRGLIV